MENNQHKELTGFDLSDDSWPLRIYSSGEEYIEALKTAIQSADPSRRDALEKEITSVEEWKKCIDMQFKTIFKENAKNGIFKIATYLIQKHYIRTISGTKREVFVYKDGIYIIGEDILKNDIRDLLEELCTTHCSKEIIDTIKDRTVTDRKMFRTDLNLINLKNGVFDIYASELKPHDPRHLFFTKIPVEFDRDADCPRIKQYLKEILEEDQITVIQEWIGYILYREYFIKKALICVGEGDTGKTTLLSLINDFSGPENVSGVSLQKITYDKFAAAHLYTKSVNLYDDLSVDDIKDNGAFKIATGGGIITGEKKFGDQFQFKNYAKLTFACNKIPDVKDANDDAYFNRWIVIQFSRVVEEDKKDRQLIHKLTTDQELSGLLNFALEGLKRLLKNQRFSYDKETHEIKTEMMRSASTIARFADDCLEEVKEVWVSRDDMYQAYMEYCSAKKIPSASQKTFGSRLPMSAPYIAGFKPKDPNDPKGKKQVTAWRNVKLKTIEADTHPEEYIDETEQPDSLFIS